MAGRGVGSLDAVMTLFVVLQVQMTRKHREATFGRLRFSRTSHGTRLRTQHGYFYIHPYVCKCSLVLSVQHGPENMRQHRRHRNMTTHLFPICIVNDS